MVNLLSDKKLFCIIIQEGIGSMINKIIIYITFIPWILFYSKLIHTALKETKYKKINFSWLKKHFNNIIHFDILILIVLFYYFSKYDDYIVDKMLFSVINLYLFVNSYYDKRNISKNKLNKEDLIPIIIIVLISIIPFILYEMNENLLSIYQTLFIYSLFAYILVLIIRLIISKISCLNKKVRE